MKSIKLSWSKLTDTQREQAFKYAKIQAEIDGKKAFIHDVNNKSWDINSYTGNLSM